MANAIQYLRLAGAMLLCLAAAGLRAQNAQPATNASAPATSENYKLVPQDKFTFRIDEDPIKTGGTEPLIVGALGDVQIPVSRGYDARITVQASGRTLKEIADDAKSKLEKDYYKQATVHVRLVDQSKRVGQVLFYGMVRGTVELFPGEQKSLSAAIIQLGYTEFADLKHVKLHRIDPATNENKTTIVDVKEILKTNDRTKDPILQDKDRVEVPERGFIF